MKAIAAMSENRVIGNKNQIPWRVSDDFKWFKEFTLNKAILVGSNTYKSLPITLLKNRKILVLSSKLKDCWYNAFTDVAMSSVEIEEIPRIMENQDIIIAGGAQIYSLFLPQITEFYVTQIKAEYEGDAFMPPFEHLFSRQEIVRTFGEHKVIKYVK